MEEDHSGTLMEWVYPLAVFVCCGWVVWHTPGYILDFYPPSSESLYDQMSQLHLRKDIAPFIPGLFGSFTDFLDWLAILAIPVLFFLGSRNVQCAPMEYVHWHRLDRFSIFVGRVTMIMIISMTMVMLYEVLLRYVFEAPTLWANELTLWIAGFVFLCSGLYAMQQRCHIRIFLLYEVVPRWMQKTFDTISVVLLVFLAFFLVYGSFKQVFHIKFYKWEMFGTAFDPPIPATIQPMILIIVTLIAAQAILNLVVDWNRDINSKKPDLIDKKDLEAIKRAVKG